MRYVLIFISVLSYSYFVMSLGLSLYDYIRFVRHHKATKMLIGVIVSIFLIALTLVFAYSLYDFLLFYPS